MNTLMIHCAAAIIATIPRTNADRSGNTSHHLYGREDQGSERHLVSPCFADGLGHTNKPARALNTNILDPVTTDRGRDFCRTLPRSVSPGCDAVHRERA